MSRARPRLRLLFALLLVFAAASRADGACNETCRSDIARCMATHCAGVPGATCRRSCRPAAIRTLAYGVVDCRADGAGMHVVHEELRIRRGDRQPITVVEFPGEPMPDPPSQSCRQLGESRNGTAAVLAGVLERLGVSPDGSAVVFEVTDDTAVIHFGPPLTSEQKGMFLVRADGSGLRRLGPASRDPSFRIGPPGINARYTFSVVFSTSIPFSPNGRRIAFTDLGPGPEGGETVQIVVLDLVSGRRTQVTHLPSASLPPSVRTPRFVTAYPTFVDDRTVRFFTYLDPDGSTPEHHLAGFTVQIAGGMLKPIPTPVGAAGGPVVPIFGVAQLTTNLFNLTLPGVPANAFPGSDFPITEIFIQVGKNNLVQLTHFNRVDTFSAFLNGTRTRAFFRASADPLGTNPYGNCQIFSVDTLGSGLRQVTHFNPGRPVAQPACALDSPPGCFVGYEFVGQDPVTKAVVFDTACDPLGANPFGDQIFAIRPDGTGLRQLTDAAGFTTHPDGSVRVELPALFAYSATLH